MPIVMQMSTDNDIVNTQLDPAWPPVTARFTWTQVSAMNLGLAVRETIIVIAHGNGTEIGNAVAGTVDIDATHFLSLIQGNMHAGIQPAAIYISTCGPGIAEFTANVRLLADANQIWADTHTFGHHDPVAGPVPSPTAISWTQIF